MIKKISYLSFICLMLSLSACYVAQPYSSMYSKSDFKHKYISFYEEGEVELDAWYHFSKTKTKDGRSIYRQFFPETMTLTQEVEFQNKTFSRKEGKARYWSESGTLIKEGNYQNNLATGEWKFYHRKSGALQSKGTFEDGNKVGKWTIYDHKGRKSQEVEYVNDLREGPFMEFDSNMVMTNKGVYKSDTIFTQDLVKEVDEDALLSRVEQMPYLTSCKSILEDEERNECSTQALLKYIYSNLKYPAKARDLELQGAVMVEFIVEKDGSVSNIDVYKGLNQYFKDEVYRVVNQMPSWEAGTQMGKKVRVLFKLPVRFKLT